MHTIPALLDLARTHSKLPSDNQLAEAWGVKRAQISQWRNGVHVLSGEHAAALAKLTGLTEEYVLICILSAERNKSAEEKRVLQQIAGKLRRTAAVITLGIAGILGFSHSPPARAVSVDAPIMYIMLRRWWISAMGLKQRCI